jgi:deoxyribodipyrimidine photo-lyase
VTPAFPPSRAAALARLAAIDWRAYGRTRNQLDGAVTRVSPYLTHGVLSVPEVIAALHVQGARNEDKLVMELAWREYWHHVWRRLGDAIFVSQRPEPAPQYAQALPDDIRQGRSGVPAVDAAVRALYTEGYVHNHARLWLASYVVHLRKVHWSVGAAWMAQHLLDGDLASNTLSWQWVAGTFSSKPYVFNNDNVARHAPGLARAGTAIDRDYIALDALARAGEAVGPEPDAPARGLAEPALHTSPPGMPARGIDALPLLAGRSVALVHPWMLGERPQAEVILGVIHLPFHARFAWSAARWNFVLELMRPMVDALWIGDLRELAGPLRTARSVVSQATLNPEYATALPLVSSIAPAPRQFRDPAVLARSFSQFWTKVNRPRDLRVAVRTPAARTGGRSMSTTTSGHPAG